MPKIENTEIIDNKIKMLNQYLKSRNPYISGPIRSVTPTENKIKIFGPTNMDSSELRAIGWSYKDGVFKWNDPNNSDNYFEVSIVRDPLSKIETPLDFKYELERVNPDVKFGLKDGQVTVDVPRDKLNLYSPALKDFKLDQQTGKYKNSENSGLEISLISSSNVYSDQTFDNQTATDLDKFASGEDKSLNEDVETSGATLENSDDHIPTSAFNNFQIDIDKYKDYAIQKTNGRTYVVDEAGKEVNDVNGNIYTTVNSIKILKTFNKLTNGRDEDLYNGKTIGKILKYTYNTITELLQNPNIVSSGMSLDSIAYEVSKKFPVSNSQTGNTIKDCIYNIFSSKAGEFSKLTIHNNDIEQGNNKIVELLASCVGMTREQVSQYMDKIPELEQQNVMTRQSENTSTTTNNN